MSETAATHSTNGHAVSSDPVDVVRSFLLAFQDGRLDDALALVDDDIVYTNVSLPTIRGRAQLTRGLRLWERSGARFRVHFHAIAREGSIVLTDRSDAIGLGPVEQRFWVYGRFEVRDGKITLWRDSFDWLDITVSLLRGIAGAISPRLNRRWPGDA
ncbi:MAG TPA: limonene-1,2-epoxide hydrolase family protein [Solirubrobacteraceae bacterium]